MYSKKYSQCGYPLSGWGLNLSKGSDPYTRLLYHHVYLDSITLDEHTYEINEAFETLDEAFRYLSETFVPDNNLQGYFFTSQYLELLYSNEEKFNSGSFIASSYEDADTDYDLRYYNHENYS